MDPVRIIGKLNATCEEAMSLQGLPGSSESLTGRTCLGVLIKKTTILKDGTETIKINCMLSQESVFGDMECGTNYHKIETTYGELVSGKEVYINKCTDYADGHQEIM